MTFDVVILLLQMKVEAVVPRILVQVLAAEVTMTITTKGLAATMIVMMAS